MPQNPQIKEGIFIFGLENDLEIKKRQTKFGGAQHYQFYKIFCLSTPWAFISRFESFLCLFRTVWSLTQKDTFLGQTTIAAGENWECKAFIFFKKIDSLQATRSEAKKGGYDQKGVYHVMPGALLTFVGHKTWYPMMCLFRQANSANFTLIRYLYDQQKDDLPAAAPISSVAALKSPAKKDNLLLGFRKDFAYYLF